MIAIPSEAIFLRERLPYVYTVKDDKVSLTSVELGIRDKHRVEIISGLEVGQEVVIKGQSRLYPGILVKTHLIDDVS